MSRNADEGCEMYEELFNKNVNLVFLKEPHINTEVYRAAMQKQIEVYVNTGNMATDKFLNSIIEALNQFTIDLAKEQIRLAFEQSEKEVEDLHQRTREGIETARLNGKQIGQQKGKKLNVKKAEPAKELIKKYNKDFGGQLNNQETWELIKISKMTFYKYKKEIMREMMEEATL
jgi:DNA invertase Pin-like site-specific DNA recombinase